MLAIEKLAKGLLNNLEIAPAFPIAIALLLVLLHWMRLLRFDLRLALYLAPALVLAAVYAFSWAFTIGALPNIVVITPQAIILLSMVIVVTARRFASKDYRCPSPWWVVLVAGVGYGWTEMWVFALSGPSS